MQGLPRGQKWGEHAGVWRDGAGVRKCLRGVRRGKRTSHSGRPQSSGARLHCARHAFPWVSSVVS